MGIASGRKKREMPLPKLDDYMQSAGFSPNSQQLRAINHIEGPLFLPAGPGSGKTRVLLWRAFNLIVFHGVPPAEIFLSTFTEKAARQLTNGLQSLLAFAIQRNGKPYDISEMYVGTLHSLCRKLLADRRFGEEGKRPRAPIVLDEISQFMYLYRGAGWDQIASLFKQQLQIDDKQEIAATINQIFGSASRSKIAAVENLIGFFNRVSEESPDIEAWDEKAKQMGMKRAHQGTRLLFKLYRTYIEGLSSGIPPRTDLSYLQTLAYRRVQASKNGGSAFRHVIIDEYQDTNNIQERLIFGLSSGSKNLCVVGDDDQALYRFRGATVENFVFFPQRYQKQFKASTVEHPITRNYRSLPNIIKFYSRFIKLIDWKDEKSEELYRVPKKLLSHRKETCSAVVATTRGNVAEAASQVALLVQKLLRSRRVRDPNQIAFLFPSLTGKGVKVFKSELEALGMKVYAPRAGSFFETEEAMAVVGLIGEVFGVENGDEPSAEYSEYLKSTRDNARSILETDPLLTRFVEAKKRELAVARKELSILSTAAGKNNFSLDEDYDWLRMKRPLSEAPGLTSHTKRAFLSSAFERIALARRQSGNPFTLRYAISRAISLDWTLLDLFYRFCAFDHFKTMFDQAENDSEEKDEGPLCNLSLMSGYLDRFLSDYFTLISPEVIEKDLIKKLFFGQYLFILYRTGQSEYESPEDPFPRGRIPFLTIHQAKGLEFPVVVIGSLHKHNRTRAIDELLDGFCESIREPKEKRSLFDHMRKFYVAFSRAENLLVVANAKNYVASDFQDFVAELPTLQHFSIKEIPTASEPGSELPRNYSYTGDYLYYARCPRQYMVFRRYGFAPSRTQAIAFGSLVHQTIEDLHMFLLARKKAPHA